LNLGIKQLLVLLGYFYTQFCSTVLMMLLLSGVMPKIFQASIANNNIIIKTLSSS